MVLWFVGVGRCHIAVLELGLYLHDYTLYANRKKGRSWISSILLSLDTPNLECEACSCVVMEPKNARLRVCGGRTDGRTDGLWSASEHSALCGVCVCVCVCVVLAIVYEAFKAQWCLRTTGCNTKNIWFWLRVLFIHFVWFLQWTVTPYSVLCDVAAGSFVHFRMHSAAIVPLQPVVLKLCFAAAQIHCSQWKDSVNAAAQSHCWTP
jgi:hypothetical protein